MRECTGAGWTACLVSFLALSACESDDKKLARLEQERATECLLEQAYHDKAMNARKKSVNMSPEADSLGRHWLEHRAKCQIANRDYNRLMR